PVLWNLLDARQGGRFTLAPVAAARSERAYLPETCVLRTEHHGDGGSVAVTDFMPARRGREAGGEAEPARTNVGMLVRIVEGLQGRVAMRLQFAQPSAPFAADHAPGALLYSDAAPPRNACDEVLHVAAGERRTFVLSPPCEQAQQAARD